MMARGTLHVRLERAAGLKAMDRNGKSDPYVKLSLCGKTHKSKVVKENLNPHWDQQFTFAGELREIVAEPLHLRVMDHDMITRDDFLGEADVDLGALRSSRQHSAEVALSVQGHVYLQFTWQTETAETDGIQHPGDNSHRSPESAPAPAV